MKRLLAIAIASVLLLSACGQNESIPFSDLMSREIKVVCAEDRIGYQDIEAYMQRQKELVEAGELACVLVRMQPLERIQYMVFRTDDGHCYLDGYTTTWVKILEVYEQIGEAELAPGEKISFRQEYYLQPQTEEDMEEMFLSLGGSIEEDSQGNRIGRIEAYRDLPIDPDIAMVMKGLFERAKAAEGR